MAHAVVWLMQQWAHAAGSCSSVAHAAVWLMQQCGSCSRLMKQCGSCSSVAHAAVGSCNCVALNPVVTLQSISSSYCYITASVDHMILLNYQTDNPYHLRS